MIKMTMMIIMTMMMMMMMIVTIKMHITCYGVDSYVTVDEGSRKLPVAK